MSTSPDIQVRNEGSIFLFHPLTDAGQEWLDEHTPEGHEVQYWGKALVVEFRYVADIVDGMTNDGLVVA